MMNRSHYRHAMKYTKTAISIWFTVYPSIHIGTDSYTVVSRHDASLYTFSSTESRSRMNRMIKTKLDEAGIETFSVTFSTFHDINFTMYYQCVVYDAGIILKYKPSPLRGAYGVGTKPDLIHIASVHPKPPIYITIDHPPKSSYSEYAI